VSAFDRLSERIGSKRVVWRYDPILFIDDIDEKWHLKRFADLAAKLEGRTDRCMVSFVDLFRKASSNIRKASSDRGVRFDTLRELPASLPAFAESLRDIADIHHIELFACAEPPEVIEQTTPHVRPGKCVDDQVLAELGVCVSDAKDKGQRDACGCVQSREIGMYDSCRHGCAFCYATGSLGVAEANRARHYPDSASMLGWLPDDLCPVISETQLRLGV
jgi:hypothetical protein